MVEFKQLSDLQSKRDKAAKEYIAYAEAQEEVKAHGDVTIKAPSEARYLLTLKAAIILLLVAPLCLVFFSLVVYAVLTSFISSSNTGIVVILFLIGAVMLAYTLFSVYAAKFYGTKHCSKFKVEFSKCDMKVTQGVLQEEISTFNVNGIKSVEFDENIFSRLSGISSLALYAEKHGARKHLITLDGFRAGSDATAAVLDEIKKRTKALV